MATIVINLAYGFSRTGIDNYAHIGGLIGGFLASGIFSRARIHRWYINRWLYLVLMISVVFSGTFYGFHNKQNNIIGQVSELIKLDQDQKWAKAEKKAEDILKLNPEPSTKASVLWTAVKAEALNGKYHEAVEHAKMLIKVDPRNGHYILGVIYFDMKEYKLSKRELLQAKKAGAKYEHINEILNLMAKD